MNQEHTFHGEHRVDGRNAAAAIVAALEPGEAVEAVFSMGGGLEIHATDRRFFGRRAGRMIAIAYDELSEVRRRRSRGIVRGTLGVVFLAASAVTGFDAPAAAAIGFPLLLIGAVFLYLALFMRAHWVEMRIKRKEPLPSLGHLVMFLPFWLLLRHGKRYTAPGTPEQVDAFCAYLDAKLRARSTAP